MSLLLPLGLLGLLSIIGLILIYIIKPNYQQKFISSTYIWKLSLKYRKKKIPVNRLKNIILFICQILILVSCAFLLARPVIPTQTVQLGTEKVAIIDASASMLVKNESATRFERAVADVKELAAKVESENGILSVIIADDFPRFLAQRAEGIAFSDLNEKLDALTVADSNDANLPVGCSHASADLDGAAALAENVLLANPDTEVILYTATDYINKGKFTVVNVADSYEWNAAVLDCSAVLEENYYTFIAQVGCYSGRAETLNVYCEIFNYNNTGNNIKLNPKSEMFTSDEREKTVKFTAEDQMQVLSAEGVYSFDSATISVEAADSLEIDNTFHLFSGKRSTLKIQYVSSTPNKFINNALPIWREIYKAKFNIELSIVREEAKYETEGFDMYIFEHERMPSKMPTDGVVFLIDPSVAPENAGFRLGGQVNVNSSSTLSAGMPHALTNKVNASAITLARYRKIVSHDGFDELMYYGGDPVFLAKNTPTEKVMVLMVDLNYSNLSMTDTGDYVFLMNNIFQYYFPSTLKSSTYHVGDTIDITPRGSALKLLSGPGIGDEGISFQDFPAQLKVTRPGPYTLEQLTLRGDKLEEQFYVGIANYESNITKEVDALPILNISRKTQQEDKDLLIYIAAALVALLFVEWWLQSREYF